jgi:hypothetical protein
LSNTAQHIDFTAFAIHFSHFFSKQAMSTLTRQVHVHDGRITLNDVPFAEDTELTVVLVPISLPVFQPNIAGWMEACRLTASISGSLAEDVIHDRKEGWLLL